MEFHEKYAAKGLNIMSVSSEARGTLEEYGKKNGITYPVGIDPTGGVSKSYPGSGIPRCFLVGADGTVVWQGHPSSLTAEKVEEQLANVKLFKLRDVVPALAEAKKAFEALCFGKAFKAAKTVLDKKNVKEEDTADAQYVQDEVKAAFEAMMKAVERYIERKAYFEAVEKLTEMAKEFEGTEYQKTALDKKKELEADKAVKVELDAGKQLKAMLDKLATMKKAKDKKACIPAFEQFIAKYKDTQAAEKAKSEIERLKAMKD